jgi:hypothetical protein
LRKINIDTEFLQKEYFALLNTINESDKRLLTIKGWGVTLSLASLGWGFQHEHYGLFLVAALSGLGFWIIEGVIKRHQMRHYVRMREIEIQSYEKASEEEKSYSSPRIDWSWSQAPLLYSGKIKSPRIKPEFEKRISYNLAWLFPHIFLPHIISFIVGIILLCLGHSGYLGCMRW